MIREIRYKNFKALRDATLRLNDRFTLIIGANGTGKTTAMKALELPALYRGKSWDDLVSVEAEKEKADVTLIVESSRKVYRFRWAYSDRFGTEHFSEKDSGTFEQGLDKIEKEEVESFRMFSFEPNDLAKPSTKISPSAELVSDGSNLAGVLDFLLSTEEERWKELNAEVARWFPEFKKIEFEMKENEKSIVFRTRIGNHKIKSRDISDGTMLGLAYLTLAYLPNPPQTVCFEEPERGIHPRLLRNIQEAMYRLAFPENYGDDRKPIQVIATSHSPYLLDLYRDYPDEVVIAGKDKDGVHFERLVDKPHIEEFLKDAPLGDVWYSGVLGGVPANI